MKPHSNLDPTVTIDAFPASVSRYGDEYAIVCIDVIRATTVAVTSVACGRRCFLARNPEHAFALRDELGGGLLAGELKGIMPNGFDINNSPADLDLREDSDRPLIMISSSGTELMLAASGGRRAAFSACFRNAAATAAHLIGQYPRVALIGAGSRGEFREEDQIGCAWIASALVQAGYRVHDSATRDVIARWENASPEDCANGNSVAYLRRTGQMRDFDFVVDHINDLSFPVAITGIEVAELQSALAA